MGEVPVDFRPRETGGFVISDITRDIANAVRASGVCDGICCVYSRVTTSVLRVATLEPLTADGVCTQLVARLLPHVAGEAMDDDCGTRKGHDAGDTSARCLSMLFSPASESVPVADGELCLGPSQRVLLIDFDGGNARDERGWLVQVVGRRDDELPGGE